MQYSTVIKFTSLLNFKHELLIIFQFSVTIIYTELIVSSVSYFHIFYTSVYILKLFHKPQYKRVLSNFR